MLFLCPRCRLPDAPEMEILCLYGVGILTERAFVYKVSPANDTCVIPFRIDTSADTDASPLHSKGFTFPQSLFNATPFNTQFFSEPKKGDAAPSAAREAKGGRADADARDGSGVAKSSAMGGSGGNKNGAAEADAADEDSGCLLDGVFFGEGDETVPSISAALPCTKLWKGKTRFNPAGEGTARNPRNPSPRLSNCCHCLHARRCMRLFLVQSLLLSKGNDCSNSARERLGWRTYTLTLILQLQVQIFAA